MRTTSNLPDSFGRASLSAALCLAIALVLPLFPSAAPAQNNATVPPASLGPTGLFQYELGPGQGVALWNLSGVCSLPFYNTLRFHQDAKGAITAFCVAGYTNNPVLLGTVSGTSSRLKMQLRSTTAFPEFVFSDQGYGGDLVDRKDRLSLTFDPETRTLTGTDRVSRTRTDWTFYGSNDWLSMGDKVKMVRRTRTTLEPITFAAPATTDGTWVLLLNIVSSQKNRVSGTASVHFPNDEYFQFGVMGSYYPKTQRLRLLLKGAGEDKGANLTLSLAGPEMSIRRLTGRIGGQSLRLD